MAFRIGIIGDLHTHWDEVDVVQFNRSDYDLLLFTGDLGGGTTASSLRMARMMARLEKNTLVMPGNNDTGDIGELAAELSHRAGVKRLSAIRTGNASDGATSVQLCGYSSHRPATSHNDVTLIAARPHSMGGPHLAFPEHMAANHRVHDLESSRLRLRALVDAAATRQLLFFAHNGPTGLGASPDDMWGCDFRPDGGDWGDPDLADAISYACVRGHHVVAVIAGHMHLRTRCKRERPWLKAHDGITYVNAARVPRIVARNDDVHRHHLAMVLSADGLSVTEVHVPEGRA